ncbi:hypothetical protein [Legionella sp. PC997]|nr:hypothetical protein [Legionella sp. PC997]
MAGESLFNGGIGVTILGIVEVISSPHGLSIPHLMAIGLAVAGF